MCVCVCVWTNVKGGGYSVCFQPTTTSLCQASFIDPHRVYINYLYTPS